MRPTKVYVLYRKNNRDDEDRAKKFKKAVFTATPMISRQVDIELTTNAKEFKDLNVKQDEMPALIINNNMVFSKHVPPLEFIKQCITPPQGQQKYLG